jgi:hypothetical protein
MKYIKQADGSFSAYDETSKEFELLANLDKKRRPVFLAEDAKEVVSYLAARAEAEKPKAVTARQAHEALIRKGLADNIRNAIAGIPDPVEQAVADNWFNRSNSFERDNETLKAISTAIGLTADDVDNLFAYAATL